MKVCHRGLCSSVPPPSPHPRHTEGPGADSCRPALLQPQEEPLRPRLLSPPPHDHPCVQASACGEPEGRLCHMEPAALGTAGASVRAGAGTCVLWPRGQRPESSTAGWGGGAESHWPGWCSVHVRAGAAVSWPVPPAWHRVPSDPCSQGTEDRAAPPSSHAWCQGQGHKGRVSDVGPWPAIPRLWSAWQCRLPSWHLVPRLGWLCQGCGAGEQGHSCHLALGRHWGTAPGRAGIPAPHWGMGQPCWVSLHEGVSAEGLRSCTK